MLLHLINAEGWETTARELLPKSGEEPLHYKPKFMVLLDELIGLAENRAPLGGGRDKYRNQQFQEITESLTSIEETLHTLQSIPASLLTGRGGVDSTATRNSSSPRRNPHRKIRTSNPDHSGYTVSGFSSGASTAVPTHHSRSVPHPYDPTGTAVSSDQGNNNGGYAIYQSPPPPPQGLGGPGGGGLPPGLGPHTAAPFLVQQVVQPPPQIPPPPGTVPEGAPIVWQQVVMWMPVPAAEEGTLFSAPAPGPDFGPTRNVPQPGGPGMM